MHRVIILAGGGPRKGWTMEHPKVLARVKGGPIVNRVIRQVQNRGYDCVVLTDNENVVQAVIGAECYVPPPHPAEMDWHYDRPIGGVANSIPLWSEDGRTLILCGDTAYTGEAMDAILKDQSPISVWGDVDEVYAITFLPEQAGRLKEAIDKSLYTDKTTGHLWTIYRALCSFPLRAHRFEDVIWKDLGRKTYLFDFDSVEKYEKWLKNNPWAQE